MSGSSYGAIRRLYRLRFMRDLPPHGGVQANKCKSQISPNQCLTDCVIG